MAPTNWPTWVFPLAVEIIRIVEEASKPNMPQQAIGELTEYDRELLRSMAVRP